MVRRIIHTSQYIGSFTLEIIYKSCMNYKGTGHDTSCGFQEDKAPTFKEFRHMKVLKLSANRSGLLYPKKITLVLISARGWIDPKAIVRSEGLYQWKIGMTPSGVESFVSVHEIFLFIMRYIIRNLLETQQIPTVTIAPLTGLHQPGPEPEHTTSRWRIRTNGAIIRRPKMP